MKTDAWLIKDIKHACKCRSDLCCKANSLCLTTRKSTCSTGKIKIIKSNTDKEVKTSLDLLQNLLGNFSLLLAEAKALNEGKHFINRKTADLINIKSANGDTENHIRKTAPLTSGTVDLLNEFLIVVTALHFHALFNDADDTVKGGVLISAETTKISCNAILLCACTVHKSIHRSIREIRQGCIKCKAVAFTHLGKQRSCPRVLGHRLKSVYGNASVTQRKMLVWNKLFHRNTLCISDTATVGTRTDRVVKGEHSRLKLGE